MHWNYTRKQHRRTTMSKKKKVADFSQNLKQEQIEFEKNSKKAPAKKQKKNDSPFSKTESENKSNSEYLSWKDSEVFKEVRQTETYNPNTKVSHKREEATFRKEQPVLNRETYKAQSYDNKTLEFNKNISDEQKEFEQSVKTHAALNRDFSNKQEEKKDTTGNRIHEISEKGEGSNFSHSRNFQFAHANEGVTANKYEKLPFEHKSLEFNKNISEEQKEYERNIKNRSEIKQSSFQQNNKEHNFFKEDIVQDNSTIDIRKKENISYTQKPDFKTDNNRLYKNKGDGNYPSMIENAAQSYHLPNHFQSFPIHHAENKDGIDNRQKSTHFSMNKNLQQEQQEYERRVKSHSYENDNSSSRNKAENPFHLSSAEKEMGVCNKKEDNNFHTHQNRIGEQKNGNIPNQFIHYSRNTQQEKFEKKNRGATTGNVHTPDGVQAEASILHIEIENDESITPAAIPVFGAQPQRGEINLKMIRSPGMLPHRIANIEKLTLLSGAKYLVLSSYRGTDTQKGIELSKDIYATSAKFVFDHIRIGIAHSMVREMNSTLIQYHSILEKTCGEHGMSKFGIIGHIHGYKDIQRMQRGVNTILKMKYGKSITGNGRIGYFNAMRFLRMNQNDLSPEIQNLIKQVYKRTLAQGIIRNNTGHFTSLKMLGRRKLRRYAQQMDSGYGLCFTLDIISRTKSILRTGIFTLRSAAKLADRAILLSAKAAAWGMAKTVKAIPQPIKNSKIGKRAGNTSKKIKGSYRKVKDTTTKGKLGVRKFNDRIRNFRRNPFGIRSGMQKAQKKATKALMNRLNRTVFAKPIRVLGKGFNVANSIVAGVGHLFSAISSALSGIINFLLIGLLIIILGGFVLSFISSAIGVVVSAFDFTTHKKEIREACLEQISKCYEEQKDEIARLQRTFRNVNIHYENIKDESVYKDNKIEITETTNSAELLSMATVYHDFDLEKAGKRKVKKYVRQLYNGSHIISVVEKPYTYTDSEGNEHTVVDADITLTTYYFNQLFNCKLSNKSPGIIAGSEITEQVWNYLRTAGIPAVQAAGIMGNIYGESGFDPNLVEHGNGIGFGLCQWSFERRTALENFAYSQGKSPGDLDVQLAFLIKELEPGHFNSYYTGENNYKKFMNAQDPETATYYFMWGWERPSKAAGNSSLAKRQRAARTYYDSYIDRELITEETEE